MQKCVHVESVAGRVGLEKEQTSQTEANPEKATSALQVGSKRIKDLHSTLVVEFKQLLRVEYAIFSVNHGHQR